MIKLSQIVEAIAIERSIRGAGRGLGIAESTIRSRLKKAGVELTDIIGEDADPDEENVPTFNSYRIPDPIIFTPHEDRNRYFILTSAQDGSRIHDDFWDCLKVYREWLVDCEILISGFTYQKKLFEEHDKRSEKVHFHPLLMPYISHERYRFGDEVEFCGEMNTLPTAVTPLSGFKTYTRQQWGIFPHPKVQLESVANMNFERSKQLITTGAVTLPNYIRKKAGIKAMFHHQIGAVLVEMRPDGSTYCRHLLATDGEDGSFYDLDRHITNSGVSTGHRVAAITYGDIHHEKLDPDLALATWAYDVDEQIGYDTEDYILHNGEPCLTDYLRPFHEFFHDLSDFSPRNHHNIKDHHFRFAAHQKGGQSNNVSSALMGCGTFLQETKREGQQQVVVESNHDQALLKWLKTSDYREDPENALFFLQCQLWCYSQMANGNYNPDIFQEVLRCYGAPEDVIFCNEDDSYVVLDIECGMHGHKGPNGARGSPLNISQAGMKSNTGHTHSPAIRDGAYVAGVSGKLHMGYNSGMSSWAQAHIVIYPNGKRTILTFHNGRFYA